MSRRNGRVKSNNSTNVRVHVSPRGELRVNANDVFATERVKALLDQVADIKTERAVRFSTQGKPESDNRDD